MFSLSLFRWLLLISWVAEFSCQPPSTGTHHTESAGIVDKKLNQTEIQKEAFEVAKVHPKVYCKTNPAHSFALYLPASYDTSKKFPLVIFFDPHGAGNFAVTRYSHLAEEFEVVLMGSNDSRNGLTFEQSNEIVNDLITDGISRLSVEKGITIAGFSGGARVALSSATQNQNVTSVIYCGAAMPLQNASGIFSLLGFAGINDMNYSDVVAFDQSLQNSSYPHFLIEWNGKHEWPDSATFRDAFYWITFNRSRSHQLSGSSKARQFIAEDNHSPHQTADALKDESLQEKMIYFLNGITDVDEYKTQADKIRKKPSFQKQLSDKQQILKEESTLKQQYIDDFQSKDQDWWEKEIARMNAISDARQKPMYQRLIGFISLAGFSISNNSIQQNNFPVAEKMLAIYKLADPKNSDQPFLEACLFAKQGKNDAAIQSLQKAADLGMNDASRLLGEPALVTLQQDEGFKALVSKMKGL
ncbi:MAG: hypothetical protein ABIQ74_10740 [Chitinophagales bacterium]